MHSIPLLAMKIAQFNEIFCKKCLPNTLHKINEPTFYFIAHCFFDMFSVFVELNIGNLFVGIARFVFVLIDDLSTMIKRRAKDTRELEKITRY